MDNCVDTIIKPLYTTLPSMPTPISFPGCNVVIAENQKPYIPLPALFLQDKMGTVLTCWQFSEEERQTFLQTGCLWISHLTFNQPFQPLAPSVDRPVNEVLPTTDELFVEEQFTLFGYPPEFIATTPIMATSGYQHWKGVGWYFWNQAHDEMFGPHESRHVCEADMRKYSRDVEQDKPSPHTSYVEEPETASECMAIRETGFTSRGWYYNLNNEIHGPYNKQADAIIAYVKTVGV